MEALARNGYQWLQTVKNSIILLWKTYQDYYIELHESTMMITIVWAVAINLEQKVNSNHIRMRKNHNNCNVKMPEEYNKILKFNQEQKSMKIPFVIYANMKSW